MRALLDGLYKLAGALAAVFLTAIAVLILAQIIGRFFNVLVPSANEFAGFSMAASSFLALAYTFRAGGHIRVTLVILRLPEGTRRIFELTSLAAGAVLIAFFAWHAVLLVLDSWEYDDLSDGLIAIPLWIPQCGMAAGLIVLAIALVDELVQVIRGHTPSYATAEDVVLGPLAKPDD
ncbi:MAG: TRAP transporter small permease [Pseudomonadota bacterium]